MEVNNLSLRDFTALASSSASDNAKVKIGTHKLESSSFIVMSSTNQRAMSAFLDTIKRELGPAIADMAATRMHAKFGEDTPLNMRVLRETIDDVARLANAQVNARDKFISGIDSSCSFDKAFNEGINDKGSMQRVYSMMTDKAKVAFKEAVKESFMEQTSPLSGQKVDINDLAKDVYTFNKALLAVTTFVSDITNLSMDFKINTNVIDICRSGVRIDHGSALFSLIPQMSDENCKFTLSDLHQKLFDSPLPPLEQVDKKELGEQIDKKILEICDNLKPGSGEHLAFLCSHFSKEKALDVSNNRTISFKDFNDPVGFFHKHQPASSDQAHKYMARDIARRNEVGGAASGNADIKPFIKVGSESFTIGRNTDFKFASAEDQATYKGCKPSSLSQAIIDSIANLHDGVTERQRDMVVSFLNQSPMAQVFGKGKGLLKASFEPIFPTKFTEHSRTAIEVKAGEGGKITVDIATFKDKDIVKDNGYLKMSFDIDTNGESICTDFIYNAPFEAKANELYESIQSGDLSSDQALALIEDAYSNKEIVEHEYETLKSWL